MVETKVKIVIVDDDEVSVNILQFEIDKYADFGVVGIAKNGASGIRLIEKVFPDVLFLDVELPDMQGMELLSKLKPQYRDKIHVIFYTAYDKYMIQALRNEAFDFLTKPIDPAEFKIFVERYQNKMLRSQTFEQSIKHVIDNETDKKFMVVTPTGDICFLRTSQIGYFRYMSERKIWETVLDNGKILPLKRNITAEQLCQLDDNFMQVHQSFIINLNYLMMVQDGCCLLYPPFDKEKGIVLSKKYRKEMMERFYTL